MAIPLRTCIMKVPAIISIGQFGTKIIIPYTFVSEPKLNCENSK